MASTSTTGDILAAADDEVFGAAAESDVPVVVLAGAVAGVEASIVDGGVEHVRRLVVGAEDGAPRTRSRPTVPLGELLAEFVGDANVEVWRRFSVAVLDVLLGVAGAGRRDGADSVIPEAVWTTVFAPCLTTNPRRAGKCEDGGRAAQSAT